MVYADSKVDSLVSSGSSYFAILKIRSNKTKDTFKRRVFAPVRENIFLDVLIQPLLHAIVVFKLTGGLTFVTACFDAATSVLES